MAILKWCIVLLAVLQFGFMAFDGSRALIKGDYIRPKTGEYAGQLGPWSKITMAVGINPEGNFMKVLFVLWGVAGLWLTYRFIQNPTGALMSLLIFDACTLWYLTVGTVSSVIQIVLLVILRSRLGK